LFGPSNLAIAVLIAMLALISAMRAPELRDSLPRAAALILGILYIFGCWHTAVGLRALSPYWLFFGLALNWIGDTAAMAVGRAIGRHKLAPRISPGKSWEGSVASVVASVLFGMLYAHWALPSAPVWLPGALAFAGNVAGQVGDLCESALKRGAGMKDSGTLLPGHGGWLDRVDSSLFSVPVVYALLSLANA
jgi:phosphatidate cytidylyltransferase